MVLVEKNLPANAGDLRDAGSIHGSERSPGGGHGNQNWQPVFFTGPPPAPHTLPFFFDL